MKSKFFLSALLVYFCGCVTVYNPATERQETYFINDEAEVKIGNNIAQSVKKDVTLVTDKGRIAHLVKIGLTLVAVSDRDYLNYKFHIVEDEGMNAFALPGGYIFVNSGLIEKTSEDELAFVIAHEIGHIAARHSIKKLQASLGMSIILGVAMQTVKTDIIKNAVDIVYNVVALGYSRSDEFLADALAVKYTRKAGYDPHAGITLMEKLHKDSKNEFTLTFLRSHPPPEQRIAAIEQKIQQIQD